MKWLSLIIAGWSWLMQDFTDHDLMGTWKWVKSTGALLGNVTTAEKTSKSKTVVFSRDHVALLYVNDSLTFKNNFFVVNEKTIFSEEPMAVLKIKGMLRSQLIDFSGKDTLVLKETAFDGFIHQYVRVK